MSTEKTHDLYDFMQQITKEMAAEYDRIQKRATEDPGTAGDQGEENWAQLLREWLPAYYHVVTKGRVINEKGETSPQIDVLVLKPFYPPKLRNTKLYLAAGVAAAFECKTTLKAEHIEKAIKTCANIKSLFKCRTGSPYTELHAPTICGLLAHSHSWKKENSAPLDNIDGHLIENAPEHPRLELDLLCVADLANWSRHIQVHFGEKYPGWIRKDVEIYKPEGCVSGGYFSRFRDEKYHKDMGQNYTAVGAFLSELYGKLAREDPLMREMSTYFRGALGMPSREGLTRLWPASVFSDTIRGNLISGQSFVFASQNPWDEWSHAYS